MNIYIQLIPAALLVFSVSAQAAMTITMKEVGDTVVISGSGSINSVNGAGAPGNLTIPRAEIAASFGYLGNGDSSVLAVRYAFPLNAGPNSYGSGGGFTANSAVSGDTFSIHTRLGEPNQLGISFPAAYVLGDALRFEMTFTSASLVSLGVEPGTYKWSWGTPTNGDSVTLYAGVEPPAPAPATATPVPALGAFGLIGLAGAIGAAGVAMARRRKSH